MYIEDSVTSQFLVRKYLEQKWSVTVAATLQNAQELLQQNQFSLIITDYTLPEGSAMGLVRQLRASHAPLDLPIILVSASMDRVLVTEALRSGVNDYLQKPIRREEVCELVQQMSEHPYVRPLALPCFNYTCFEWEKDGKFHAYCPEIEARVQSDTRELASESILEHVREYIRLNGPPNLVQNARSLSKLIELQ